MKLVTQKSDLVDALSVAGRAVSTKTSLQILSGILLNATADGADLIATDTEISIRRPFPARVEEPGAVVVPARILTDIAKNLPAGEVTLVLSAGENQVEVEAGDSRFVLNCLPASDFPRLPVFPTEQGFTVEKSAFLETIDRVAPSASKDETRPVLSGVLIHVTKSAVKMVATDSYRLSVKETPITATVGDKVEAIIPARSLTELSRVGAGNPAETVTVVPGENQVLFDVGGVWLISRLLDGQFPNYRQLLPDNFEQEVQVEREELLDVVHRVGLLALRNAPLRLRFHDNTLTVAAESQDVGRAWESLPIRYSGEELEIGFNPTFLEAGIQAVIGPRVNLKFISPLRPGLIMGESDDFLYLIMPIRLTD